MHPEDVDKFLKTYQRTGALDRQTSEMEFGEEILKALGKEFLDAPEVLMERERLNKIRSFKVFQRAISSDGFNQLVDLTKSIFSAKIALISLVGDDIQWFLAEKGLGCSSTPRNVSFCGHAILNYEKAKAFVVLDTFKDWRFKRNPLVLGSPFIRFYAGSPLVSTNQEGEKFLLGTLCIVDDEPRTEFNIEQQERLTKLAGIVMTQLEFYSGNHVVKKELSSQKSTNELIQKSLQIPLAEVYKLAVDVIYKECDAEYAAILEVNPLTGEGVAAHGKQEESLQSYNNANTPNVKTMLRYCSTVEKQLFTCYGDFPLPFKLPDHCQNATSFMVLKIIGEENLVFGYLFACKMDNADLLGEIDLLIAEQVKSALEFAVDRAFKIQIIERSAVTEHKNQLDLAESNERLRTIKKIFSMFSHEMKTPLYGIIASLEDKFCEACNGSIWVIRSCCQSMLTIINDFTDAHRLSNRTPNPFMLQKENFTVSSALSASLAVLRHKFIKEEIHLTCKVLRRVEVHSDYNRFHQILLNVLGNAIKFSSKNSTISIIDNLSESHMTYYLFIKDEGIGLEEGQLDKIGSEFYQQHPEKGGMGLGIHICKEILRELNGSLSIYNRKDGIRGSEVKIEIPVVRYDKGEAFEIEDILKEESLLKIAQFFSEDQMRRQKYEDALSSTDNLKIINSKIQERSEKSSEGSKKNEPKLMIIDDNNLIRRMIVKQVNKIGYTNTVDFASADDSINYVRAGNTCDIVISDYSMPGNYNGATGSIMLKKLMPNVKIVILSAVNTIDEPTAADYILKKPITAEEMKKCLEDLQ